jgi:2'-5' RNA ligase
MRCFLAIEIPDEIKEKIILLQKEIEKCNADLKFVERENLHLTIKFFGDVNDEKLLEIEKAIENAINKIKEFEIEISSIGVFPNFNYLRVIWLSVSEGKKEIFLLHELLEKEFERIGIKKDKEFEAHLTIARVRSARNKEALIKKIKELSNSYFGKFIVKEIKLKESNLTPKGPIYHDIKTFQLV